MLRIDKAVRTPGLIRPAKTYSVFFTDDCFYALVTGPASMKVTANSIGATGAIEDAFAGMYAPKIAAGEAAIDTTRLSELAKNKHNFAFPYTTITEVVVGTDHIQGSYIQIVGGGEKLRLHFRGKSKAEVETLARNLNHEVVVK
jgi:hypothetical protein